MKLPPSSESDFFQCVEIVLPIRKHPLKSWKLLTNVTKISILDVAGALDMPLTPFYQNISQWLHVYFLPTLLININCIFWTKLLHLKSVYLFLKPFSTNFSVILKPGSWFLPAKYLKNTCRRVTFYLTCHCSTGVFSTFCW